MKTIGRHLIVEYYNCDVRALDDADVLRHHMLAAAEVIGATVVGHTFHKFSPQGVSGTVVIAESHLSVHTWPEKGYVAVDIFTCGGLDPHPGFEYLGRALRATATRVQEILRGLPEDVEACAEWHPENVQVISRMTSLMRIAPHGA